MAGEQSKLDETIKLSRRQVVTTLGVGAVTLAATHLGVAYEAAQWERQQHQPEIADLTAEVERLKGLLSLYEDLEKIGVDAVISGALSGFKIVLEGLRGGVATLRAGIGAAEGAIAGFRDTFAALRSALEAAEEATNNVAALLKNAEDLLGQTTSPIEPLIQQVRQFFDDLLGRIPFGVGDNIRRTIDGISGLVIAIPSMLPDVKKAFLEPLRATWFSDDNAKNIQGLLLNPITQKVLEPLKQFLDAVDQTLAQWEGDVAKPVQGALDRRDAVRQQIADYKSRHNMP